MENTTNLTMQFGNRLKNVRKEVGISQEELAFKSSLDRTYISSVERGKRNISLFNICILAKALEVKPNFLLEGVELK
ncbi:helix-turn-helix domain-containing protein [Exiguobacterium undae]